MGVKMGVKGGVKHFRAGRYHCNKTSHFLAIEIEFLSSCDSHIVESAYA